MSWFNYGGFPPYVPVATKIALGHAAARKLAAKEGRPADPVKIKGRKIATTFWGLKWCENLERYRDYANRLPRGATYVRNGSVADLVIEPGCVRAIVGGSEAYTVKITIKTLPSTAWKSIGRDCAREIESLLDLLQGRFSEGVMTRLTRVEDGLFPRPNEITMTCTCPDGAGVCKHIAATMYAVGSRLDVRPELLFKLRKVDHTELISHAASTMSLNQSLGTAQGMALSDGELQDIFGIEIESTAHNATGKKPPRTKARQQPAKKDSPPSQTAPSKGKTRQAVTTPAVKKRRATAEDTTVAAKKPEPQNSTQAAKALALLKARLKSSVATNKSKKPPKSTATKTETLTAAPKRATHKKKPTAAPPAKPAPRTRRTK